MSSIKHIIRSRRTIHRFKPIKPAKQLIIEAIELASWSPNHHLTQPWHFYFPSKEMVSQIIAFNTERVNQKQGNKVALRKQKKWQAIPGWLIVSCEKSMDKQTYIEDYAACCCAIYSLSLVLWEQGIGVKWTTGEIIRQQQFYTTCWLDQSSVEVVGMLWYGYPEKIPEPQARRASKEFITIF